jgi:RNA polymerase sigma-70 factor (ECF subfamily)
MEWFSIKNDDKVELSDEEILTRSQTKPWLYEQIVERYQAAFLRKAVGIIRDPEDAKEIVQDTFTKIYVNASSFTPVEGAKFSSWAYRILLNTTYTYYQKRLKQGQRFMVFDPEFEQLVADKSTTDEEETRDGVERILARLPGHFAYVLRLHYLERWSHKDIAKETGEETGTIKARVHRAKAAFKKESSQEEVELFL